MNKENKKGSKLQGLGSSAVNVIQASENA